MDVMQQTKMKMKVHDTEIFLLIYVHIIISCNIIQVVSDGY